MNKPTIKECFEYSNNMEQSTLFFHHFESQGWKVGKNPMKNWKSAITNWIKRSKPKVSKMDIAVSNTQNTVINKLWVRMSQIYGHKWVSNYGSEPSKPWIDVVARLSNEQIAYGLQQIVKRLEKWPPDLIEFRQLCTSRSKLKSLSHLPGPKEIMAQRENTAAVRIEAMNKIRGML